MQHPHRCPECDGTIRETDTEHVCADCGLVVTDAPIDHGPEWRTFSDDPDHAPERTGAPLTRSRHDRGLSTEIGYSARLTGRKRRKFARLRRQHKRATIPSKADYNRIYGFTEIRRLIGTFGIGTGLRDQACTLFASAQTAGLLHGRTIEGFAAAGVYATCRTNGVTRTLDEIAAAARATRPELTTAYDAMNRDLGLPTGPIDPREYLPRYADALSLPARIERQARELVAALETDGLVAGRNPSGVAAGCLYTAATETDHAVTQSAAAAVADVTPVTLRATYQNLTDA
ncbi:transcription initiation factor IIB [Halobacterium salinarum]|uniref:Transcription initiation factor IIB 1 n=5 Tax=Halobacterium salinarum TaxID=2242 RepID=TF2B1_HALSA|nr:transcription initiation factor IIB family protein [Halobacterium salinarum]Q9HNA2.1 RecName: Full=Transcription initiation factor IIB 1; Short=TFIIB 1 [Halobacterium salinarum NRC-1]AAG20319.1 transcription initiation factor IIB [Halobacterium salinarum NRC-1]MBB6089336.1 transcription initiation factor TFIIB [Halobacterium salinarum]MDL0120462.1 transcription initiation factor IIB family protein [Halobacterium salinarum]MDL0129556.1 transcription initiation factor IIB family protein [Halo